MKKRKPQQLVFILIFILLTHAIESRADNLDVSKESISNKTNNREKLKQDLIELESKIKSFSLVFEKVAQLVGPSVVKINITKDVRKEIEGKHGKQNGPNYHHFHPFPKPYNSPFKNKDKEPKQPEHPKQPENHLKHDIGSGIIIDETGYIITNFHVVHSYSGGNIDVILYNGKKFSGKIIGTDPKTDLAVLKIEGGKFEKAEFGDVSSLHVGDWVIAIGSPFNYQQTVSAGIISAIGRKHVSPNSSPFAYDDFIQTDASVNPGSSGGPLVNMRGEIIGVNSAIATRTGGFQGIAFAISASIAKKVANDLIKYGKVHRGHIGVGMLDIDKKLATTLGLKDINEALDYLGLNATSGSFIARVWHDTPASHAGLIPGDVILEIDDALIHNCEHLQQLLRNKHVGSTAKIIVLRDREKMPVNIKIGEQPDNMDGIIFSSIQSGALRVAFGLTVKRLPEEAMTSIGFLNGKNGLLVADVEIGSIAEKAGLEPGDVILKVGYNDVSDLLEFYKILHRFKKESKPVTLQIESKGFITLNIGLN